ncbi:TPA: hypothetical protein DEQ89_03065 [Candidatus Daviesbacteria bacterium]|uniref:YHS domain-containing protein n=1 Tax=Candidatus Daviesbacteria bacterium GW2011_GWC2_40_12 TaxID=1618431 RepID=A0A0G0QRM8_9BACT|nr:MAG: YHS domain-containing protein [Candidatus Daviesbacteria bacterium GW2011_GWA2_39_33]KKR42803.1 MAG: YHS domain-containing protein [Candidatus Daviesbacteria bacterium GW2011_GWC2_40_12]HCE30971.1 hypothetical protein [Candidatus Daviesbacteria bacterium]
MKFSKVIGQQVSDDLEVPIDEEEFVIDPICELELQPYETEYRSYHKGKLYYFCSEDCLQRFEDCPEKYASEFIYEHG